MVLIIAIDRDRNLKKLEGHLYAKKATYLPRSD